MTLKDRVEETLIKAGTQEQLADKAGVAIETVRRVLNGHKPRKATAYRLALACGCTEAEAIALARGNTAKAKRAS